MASEIQNFNISLFEDQYVRHYENDTDKMFGILSFGLVILGVAGNILCAKVIGELQRTNGKVRLIKYLTIVDILVLLLLLLPPIIYKVKQTKYLFITLRSTVFFLFPVGVTVYMFEMYLTVLIGLQRCYAVVVPLKAARVMRDSVMNKILIGIACFVFIFQMPRWIHLQPQIYWNSEYNMTLIQSKYLMFTGYQAFAAVLSPVFINAVPMIIMMVSNIVLNISRRRKPLIANNGDGRTSQLTSVTLAITLMSCAVHSLQICVYILNQKVNPYSSDVISNIMLIMKCLNSSTNCIFYCIFGREFRRTLMAMFQERRCGSKEAISRSELK